VSTIIDSGRQIKVISLVLAEIFGDYYYNPPRNANGEEEEEKQGYEGAKVIDTVKGFYGGPCEQVVLLDFARYSETQIYKKNK
jgi:DNA polymerase elongation subunit (family B)